MKRQNKVCLNSELSFGFSENQMEKDFRTTLLSLVRCKGVGVKDASGRLYDQGRTSHSVDSK